MNVDNLNQVVGSMLKLPIVQYGFMASDVFVNMVFKSGNQKDSCCKV